jgi:ribosome biogenesis GTPase
MNTTLQDLGFDDWFQGHLEETARCGELAPVRVTAVNRNNYNIRNEVSEIPAEVIGKLLYDAESRLDFPVVGDWVLVEYFNDGQTAMIHQVLPRKSLLRRKTAGAEVEYQPIAANIDIAFIVQALDRDFNPRRLERYLAMANDGNVKPVILFSKKDLVPPDEADQKTAATRESNPGYEVIAFSNKTGDGLECILEQINPGTTCCLLGSSGVGKTTLLNKIIGEDVFTTGAVRDGDGKGKHVTTRRQLTVLERGGQIVDTPGMRELGTIGFESGLDETFADVAALTGNCQFRDCTHTQEPGCSVLEAVASGVLSAKRYRSFLKLRKESEFHQMSLVDKRRKDKRFGKMIKRVMKNHKKR